IAALSRRHTMSCGTSRFIIMAGLPERISTRVFCSQLFMSFTRTVYAAAGRLEKTGEDCHRWLSRLYVNSEGWPAPPAPRTVSLPETELAQGTSSLLANSRVSLASDSLNMTSLEISHSLASFTFSEWRPALMFPNIGLLP